MTGEELYQKLKNMTEEERERKVVIEDYSGCSAQFLTVDKVNLENKRINNPDDPEEILGKDYIGIHADNCYFLG